jgi:FtsP/CotA-like multicopper oxidase with cupredoxin domain
LILPNDQDGVPYLTSAPISGHTTAVYTFPIVQNGTYWYHSHSMLQEQLGMYGAIVIHKRNEAPKKELTVLLSDWTNEKP